MKLDFNGVVRHDYAFRKSDFFFKVNQSAGLQVKVYRF